MEKEPSKTLDARTSLEIEYSTTQNPNLTDRLAKTYEESNIQQEIQHGVEIIQTEKTDHRACTANYEDTQTNLRYQENQICISDTPELPKIDTPSNITLPPTMRKETPTPKSVRKKLPSNIQSTQFPAIHQSAKRFKSRREVSKDFNSKKRGISTSKSLNAIPNKIPRLKIPTEKFNPMLKTSKNSNLPTKQAKSQVYSNSKINSNLTFKSSLLANSQLVSTESKKEESVQFNCLLCKNTYKDETRFLFHVRNHTRDTRSMSANHSSNKLNKEIIREESNMKEQQGMKNDKRSKTLIQFNYKDNGIKGTEIEFHEKQDTEASNTLDEFSKEIDINNSNPIESTEKQETKASKTMNQFNKEVDINRTNLIESSKKQEIEESNAMASSYNEIDINKFNLTESTEKQEGKASNKEFEIIKTNFIESPEKLEAQASNTKNQLNKEIDCKKSKPIETRENPETEASLIKSILNKENGSMICNLRDSADKQKDKISNIPTQLNEEICFKKYDVRESQEKQNMEALKSKVKENSAFENTIQVSNTSIANNDNNVERFKCKATIKAFVLGIQRRIPRQSQKGQKTDVITYSEKIFLFKNVSNNATDSPTGKTDVTKSFTPATLAMESNEFSNSASSRFNDAPGTNSFDQHPILYSGSNCKGTDSSSKCTSTNKSRGKISKKNKTDFSKNSSIKPLNATNLNFTQESRNNLHYSHTNTTYNDANKFKCDVCLEDGLEKNILDVHRVVHFIQGSNVPLLPTTESKIKVPNRKRPLPGQQSDNFREMVSCDDSPEVTSCCNETETNGSTIFANSKSSTYVSPAKNIPEAMQVCQHRENSTANQTATTRHKSRKGIYSATKGRSKKDSSIFDDTAPVSKKQKTDFSINGSITPPILTAQISTIHTLNPSCHNTSHYIRNNTYSILTNSSSNVKKFRCNTCNINDLDSEQIVVHDLVHSSVLSTPPAPKYPNDNTAQLQPPIQYSCYECHRPFKTLFEHNTHISFHPTKQYKCSSCLEYFMGRPMYNWSVNPSYILCPKCLSQENLELFSDSSSSNRPKPDHFSEARQKNLSSAIHQIQWLSEEKNELRKLLSAAV